MTSTTFFIVFIPVLSVILLSVNLILAPHNPYQEKDSAFECGFHSFLGQNRTQFSISFFIFGLLFLLFDLEILLVYPYSVSGYNNDVYGLVIMMVFFVLLTLGFIFELGKNALTIDSKQTLITFNNNAPKPFVFVSSQLHSSFGWPLALSLVVNSRDVLSNVMLAKPYSFSSLPLQSGLNINFSFILGFIRSYFVNIIVKTIHKNIVTVLTKYIINMWNKYPVVFFFIDNKIKVVCNIYINIHESVFMYIKKNYIFIFGFINYLYIQYNKIINGCLEYKDIKFFFLISFLLKNNDFDSYIESLLLMIFVNYIRNYLESNNSINNTFCNNLIIALLKLIYIICLCTCIDICFQSLLVPLLKKIFYILKSSVFKMSGESSNDANMYSSSNTGNPTSNTNPGDPTPNSQNPITETNSSKKNKKNKEYVSADDIEKGLTKDAKRELKRLKKSSENYIRMMHSDVNTLNLESFDQFEKNYKKNLPSEGKEKISTLARDLLNGIDNGNKNPIKAPNNVTEYWTDNMRKHKDIYTYFKKKFQVYEQNSKKIQNDSLGGYDSDLSKEFRKTLSEIKTSYSIDNNNRVNYIKDQITKSKTIDSMIKQNKMSYDYLVEKKIII